MDAIRSRVELEARIEELQRELEDSRDREEALEVKLENADGVIEQLRAEIELLSPKTPAEKPENGQNPEKPR